MSMVRIVTDSTADLPKELIDEYGIIVVPLKVSFGTDVYRDGVDISSEEFMGRIMREDSLATTSQPSPGEFVAVYEKITAKGDTIISIHLSGKLSGTVQSANTAKTMTGARDIYVVDSKSASLGLGLIVLAAARAAKEGKSVREILTLVKEKIEGSFLIFLVDSLDYLEKGGRIGKAGAFLGTILKIKPILTLDNEGQVIPLEKIRGKGKAVERITQIISERIDSSKWYKCAFVHGNDYNSMIALQDSVKKHVNFEDPIINFIGPVIMSHTGPSIVGAVFCPE